MFDFLEPGNSHLAALLKVEPFDYATQLCRGLHTHFVHYLGAMGFDRALGCMEHIGDLLVEQASHDERKDLALALRQTFVTSAPRPLMAPRLPRCGAAGQCPLHRFNQLIPLHWLGEKIY